MAREFVKGDYDELIKKAAQKHNLDHALIRAFVKTESGFNHKAVSRKGAMGLMPGTASSLNVNDSFDPWANIDGGSKYRRYLHMYVVSCTISGSIATLIDPDPLSFMAGGVLAVPVTIILT